MAKEDNSAGDDQGMAQKDRAGYSVDIQSMTGGKFKGIEENTSMEIGNCQPVDGGAPIPKA